MKFDCGETISEKLNRLAKWHRWFAWYPVKTADHDCRWLETVERKVTYEYYVYDVFKTKEYRAIK